MNNFQINSNVKSILVFDGGNDKNAFVTFLIPTFGRYDTLFRTLDSISNQKQVDVSYNIIVIDNNSDLTCDEGFVILLRKYRNLRYYVNEKNIGMFGNWNRGIELSTTKIISMIHDDDTIFSDYLIRLKKIFKQLNCQNFCYIKTRSTNALDDEGKISVKKYSFLKKFVKKMFKSKIIPLNKKYVDYVGDYGILGAPSCGTILNKEAIISAGGYSNEYYPSSDAVIFFNLLDKYKAFETIGDFGYRFYGKNESCKFETMQGFLKQYLFMQDKLATLSKHGKKIITKYKDVQVQLYIDNLKQFPESSGMKIRYDSFKDIYCFEPKTFKCFCFKLKKKIYRSLYMFIYTLFM
ncbi:glycosyltransferase family 2 protein [Pseudobutyrivibrio sp.]|uniref:glycosyltransferase family 2 protein n=1 Tax=Pseudobutyrivibrio sp. TaxID=2014367 RepID=UPI001B651588|nr:glycosyltransferase family A protein [Pseudobutyrivibrio sp.]MBP3263701.1 glycosyltransferase family 2 protein [Pseudobutyrivibrio sp.]